MQGIFPCISFVCGVHMKNLLFIVLCLSIVIFSPAAILASDLDDGISGDDKISGWDEIGLPSANINFIILDAKSKASLKDVTSGYDDGDTNINSVVVEPGGRVDDIIIIVDDSRSGTDSYSDEEN